MTRAELLAQAEALEWALGDWFSRPSGDGIKERITKLRAQAAAAEVPDKMIDTDPWLSRKAAAAGAQEPVAVSWNNLRNHMQLPWVVGRDEPHEGWHWDCNRGAWVAPADYMSGLYTAPPTRKLCGPLAGPNQRRVRRLLPRRMEIEDEHHE